MCLDVKKEHKLATKVIKPTQIDALQKIKAKTNFLVKFFYSAAIWMVLFRSNFCLIFDQTHFL